MIINLDGVLKSRDITLLTKGHIVKAMVSLVVMSGCESWTIEKAESQTIGAFILWCWRRLLRVPWSKKIKPVTPKENQPWIFIERIYAEAEAPILWPPDVRHRLTGKDPDAGKDWREKEKGAMENERFRYHHWFSGHESKQTPGDSERQGSPACCSPTHKESETTWQLNNNNTVKSLSASCRDLRGRLKYLPQKWRHKHRKQTCRHSGRSRGGKDWESGVHVYTLAVVYFLSCVW